MTLVVGLDIAGAQLVGRIQAHAAVKHVELCCFDKENARSG